MPDLLTPDELAVIAEREAKATPAVVYFVNSPDTGFDEYPTLKEALDAAEETISYFRDEAIDGWNEEVTSIRVGIITHDVEQFDVKHRKDCDEDENWACPDCDEMCDYRMSGDGDLLSLLDIARADRTALLRHIAALEARTPAPADDPELDGTDFAHPAWWRGHDQTTAMFCHHVQVILDGRAVKDESVSPEPWHTIRQRLLALMEKPAPALRETLAREQVAANVLCDTHEELGMHRAYVEDLTKERDAERERAEKAEEKLNNARYMPTQEQLESIYAALPKVLTPWREVARSHGYSMAFHGSLARDIDISFMPWIGSPSTAEALIDGLLAAADFAICPEKTNPGEVTVHGRRRWVILGAIPGPAYFDISVWPTQAERDALKADLAAARKELAGLKDAVADWIGALGHVWHWMFAGASADPRWGRLNDAIRRVLEGGAA